MVLIFPWGMLNTNTPQTLNEWHFNAWRLHTAVLET